MFIAGNVCLLPEMCVYCWKYVFIAGNVCLFLETDPLSLRAFCTLFFLSTFFCWQCFFLNW